MNQNKTIMKLTVICAASALTFASNPFSAIDTKASALSVEKPVAGIAISLDHFYDLAQKANLDLTQITDPSAVSIESAEEPEQAPVEEEPEETEEAEKEKAIKAKYENLGIATVENYLNIREKAGEDKKIIGKLPKNAGCTIYETKDGWSKIKSGKITGYVKTEYLTIGAEAEEMAKKVGMKMATVNTTTLKVREKPDVDSACLTLIPIEEELEVLKIQDDWVRVVVDNDKGWVNKEYVDISYELKKAVANEELEEDATNGITSTRAAMVSFAKQFLGNPYVWGGTSLTNGTDCSGFTQGIYSHFGIAISRNSRAQAQNGTTISYTEAKPGDLIFYGKSSYINHVAMYIGNGQVIHASNPRSGIKISNMNYRTPVKAVRIINS